jgi:sortase (surface protein transpeptidase)
VGGRGPVRLARLVQWGAALAVACAAAGVGAHAAGLLPVPGTAAAQRPAAGAVRPSETGPAAPLPSPSDDGVLAAAQALVAPAAPPARLRVPAIGVDARVEAVGLDAQGRMATPSGANTVAWYQPGATPGDVGDAVIAGHLDWTSGPAVFWYLGKLHRGDDVVVVRTNGSEIHFIVDGTSMMPYDAPTDGLFTRNGPPALTLITCAGSWDRQRGTYLQRLVVHAALAPAVAPSQKAGA